MHRIGQDMYSDLIDRDTVDGVVAVEPAGQFVRVFTRTGCGTTFRDHPFKPFMLLADPNLLDTAPVPSSRHHLTGNGALCWLVQVTTWHEWCQLRDHLQQAARSDAWFGFPDSTQQFLIKSGIRFFKGLESDDLTLLCIAITTAETDQQAAGSVQLKHERITAIAIADNSGYEEIISSSCMAEPEMLERLSRVIRDKDPDVITGYRLARLDLPRIIRRAGHYGIRLDWGRDGTEPHVLQGSDKYRLHKNHGIYGRSIVDTLPLVKQYDRLVRPLPGTGLRQVAEWFGCAAQKDDASTGLQADVREALSLYQLLVPVWHQQTQLYPVSFQSAVSRPGIAAVSALLMQEYLFRHHALPALLMASTTEEQSPDELFLRGKAGPVVFCDLSELPASIMLSYRIAPQGDDLDIFLPLLGSIMRLCSQQLVRHEEMATLPLQAFLLPAWLELLTHSQLPFSDTDAAGEVKRLWRVITGDLLGWLREQGAVPVSAVQQGIYFVPPDGHTGLDEITMLIKHLKKVLPNGANLHYGGHYQAMFTYSLNNYALLEQNGTMVYRGNRFSYRSMEPFLMEFLKGAVGLLLAGKAEGVRTLYASYLRRLMLHDCPVSWLTRTETLADTPENYQKLVQAGKRNRAAVYELALSMSSKWVPGDRISYYVAGNSKNIAAHDYCRFVADFDPAHPDLNISWYAERLHQLFKRLEPFLPAEPMLF